MLRIWLLTISLLFGVASFANASAEVEIDSVVWYYKPEKVFKRIGEYFDGEERTGRKTIIRTQPEGPRRGLYFIVRIDEYASDLPQGCYFEVDVLRPDQKHPVTKRFEFKENEEPHREIWLGFTGEDNPANNEPPVAWRVRMFGPDGKVLCEHPSFLWSKPADAAAETN